MPSRRLCSLREGGFPDKAAKASADGTSSCCSLKDQWKELSHEDLEPPPEHVPPPPRPPKRILEPHNGKRKEFFSNHQWVKDEAQEGEDGPIKEEAGTPLRASHSMDR